MTTLVNGIATQQLSVSDRGLLYGQTVFETICVYKSRPLLLREHLKRLTRGCEVLAIPLDSLLEKRLEEEVHTLCEGQELAVLRLCLSMGEGGRGYRNPDQPKATRILSRHGFPDHPKQYWQEGIRMGLASIRLASQPALAGIKHGNRLEQIIARSQWQNDWQEALLCNQAGGVVEATQSNVFIVRDGTLLTPSLDQCGVAGVMREWVLTNAHEVGVDTTIVPLSISEIETADEVFLTNSLIGLWPVKHFQKSRYQKYDLARKLLNLMKKNEVIPNF